MWAKYASIDQGFSHWHCLFFFRTKSTQWFNSRPGYQVAVTTASRISRCLLWTKYCMPWGFLTREDISKVWSNFWQDRLKVNLTWGSLNGNICQICISLQIYELVPFFLHPLIRQNVPLVFLYFLFTVEFPLFTTQIKGMKMSIGFVNCFASGQKSEPIKCAPIFKPQCVTRHCLF